MYRIFLLYPVFVVYEIYRIKWLNFIGNIKTVYLYKIICVNDLKLSNAPYHTEISLLKRSTAIILDVVLSRSAQRPTKTNSIKTKSLETETISIS